MPHPNHTETADAGAQLLFKAAQCAKQHDIPQALQCLQQAVQAGGLDANLFNRLAIQGHFNYLGRATALATDPQDHQLLAKLRRSLCVENPLAPAAQCDEQQPITWAKRHRQYRRLAPFDLNARLARGQRTVIVVAGMRHSGSTALFNILRLAFIQKGLLFKSGYSEQLDISSLADERLLLLKTHEFRDDIKEPADFVFTTLRDLRDTVASAKRRDFNLINTLGVIEYAKYNRQLHELWAPLSSYEFHYEAFMQHPREVIKETLARIGLTDCDLESIDNAVHTLPTDDYKTTLLSPTHITDPERKASFSSTLGHEADTITQHAKHWLKRNGYTI